METDYLSFILCGSEICATLLPIWSIPPPICIECERLDNFPIFIFSNRAVIATYACKEFMRVLKLDLFFIHKEKIIYSNSKQNFHWLFLQLLMWSIVNCDWCILKKCGNSEPITYILVQSQFTPFTICEKC